MPGGHSTPTIVDHYNKPKQHPLCLVGIQPPPASTIIKSPNNPALPDGHSTPTSVASGNSLRHLSIQQRQALVLNYSCLYTQVSLAQPQPPESPCSPQSTVSPAHPRCPRAPCSSHSTLRFPSNKGPNSSRQTHCQHIYGAINTRRSWR